MAVSSSASVLNWQRYRFAIVRNVAKPREVRLLLTYRFQPRRFHSTLVPNFSCSMSPLLVSSGIFAEDAARRFLAHDNLFPTSSACALASSTESSRQASPSMPMSAQSATGLQSLTTHLSSRTRLFRIAPDFTIQHQITFPKTLLENTSWGAGVTTERIGEYTTAR